MSDHASPRLRRRVGPVAASLSGIGIVLGAGIYVLVGRAAGEAGNAVWGAFLVGAILAAATGLTYAELTAMFPEAGAAAAYAREAFGRRTAFVTGWMDVVVNAIGAPAVAIGFGGYLGNLAGWDRTAIAVAVVLICAAIVYAGVMETLALASTFAVIEAAGLIMVVAVGGRHLGEVNLLSVHGGSAGLLGAAALVFFAYEGFEEIATLSEEVIDPTRNIPRALLIAIGATTALYITVAAVAVSVVPWEALAASEAPLADVVRAAAHSRLADAVAVVALFATFNTVLLVLATGPRAMYGMAHRGLLPIVFGRVSRRRRTPWVSILAVTVISVAFAATGDIGFVAQVTNFAVFALFIVVNGSLIRLRFTQRDRPRPFRLTFEVAGVPATAVAGILGAVLLSLFMEREAFAVGAGALVLGVALSFVLLPREVRA